MTFDEVMSALKKAGTAQNRKIYARHGAQGEMFGVSFAELGKLRKRIGTDQELAQKLWDTGNVDAMTLATMIADYNAFSKGDLDRWIRVVDYSVHANQFAKYVVAPSAHAMWAVEKWTKPTVAAKRPFVAVCGWDIVSCVAMEIDPTAALDFGALLHRIEAEIDTAPNEVRHAMNNALIAIGLQSKALRTQAIAASRRIGVVDVDHGETGCKTPAAEPYIERAWARRSK